MFVSNARFGLAQMPASFFTCQVWAGHHQSLQPKVTRSCPPCPRHPGCLPRLQPGPGGEGRQVDGQHLSPEDYTAGKRPLHHLCFCFVLLTTSRGRSGRRIKPILQRTRVGLRSGGSLATWALDLRLSRCKTRVGGDWERGLL